MKNKRRLFLVLMMLTAVLLALPVQAAPKLSRKKAVLFTGQTLQLKVKGTSKKVKWSSGDKTVAGVKKGLVTAKKAGTAVITAKVGKKKLTCRITVKTSAMKVPVKKIVLSKGRKKTFKVTLRDYGELRMKYDNSLVIGCSMGDFAGKTVPITVTAVAPGTSNITLTTNLDKTKVVIPVTVK